MATLRDELLQFVKPREERLIVDGHEVLVREWSVSADVGLFKDVTDSQYKFVVACVLDPAPETPIFTPEDIPA